MRVHKNTLTPQIAPPKGGTRQNSARLSEWRYTSLKEAESFVKLKFPHFGINKSREIVRLLYEISKRDRICPRNILCTEGGKSFTAIKKLLLRKRFPCASAAGESILPYLPKLAINSEECFLQGMKKIYPKKILIEKSARWSSVANRFLSAFPKSAVSEITSLKDYLSGKKFTVGEYNKRRDIIFIANEKYDFLKKCPCTKSAVGCGYNILNLGFGCIFDCTYCYLQEYVNSPGIAFAPNVEDFFCAFRKYKKTGMRIGSGEFSDSLMLDNITQYSLSIIDFFSRHPDTTFEFKTKSDTIKNILKAHHCGNIVISWSLNPQKIIVENEFYTASLSRRLAAARRARDAGYKIGAHFDPVFYYSGWEKDYAALIEQLFNAINPADIAWVSIGTFRFKPETKKIIEARFPESNILDGELVIGYDGKLRYPYKIRHKIYDKMLKLFRRHSTKLPIYLCMEDKSMWGALRLASPF